MEFEQDNNKRVLRHQTRHAILEMITRGELKPGDKILQEKIARRLEVSRGVLREALLDLQSSYLVELIDHQGAFVCRLTEEMLREIYFTREIIECAVVRLCCMRVNRLQLQELRTMIEEEIAAVETHDRRRAFSRDQAFHNCLVKLSGNGLLVKIVEEYMVLSKIINTKTGDDRKTCQDHLDLIQALEDNDPDRAEKIMHAHIQQGLENMIEQVKSEIPSSVGASG